MISNSVKIVKEQTVVYVKKDTQFPDVEINVNQSVMIIVNYVPLINNVYNVKVGIQLLLMVHVLNVLSQTVLIAQKITPVQPVKLDLN